MNKKVAELKALLAKDRTNSLLKNLIAIAQANGDTQLHNEVTQLQGILYKVEQDFSNGKVDKEAYDIRVQRTKNGLLSTIDLCEELGYFNNKTKAKPFLDWKILTIVGVFLLFLFGYFYLGFGKLKSPKSDQTELSGPVPKDTNNQQKTRTEQKIPVPTKPTADLGINVAAKPSQDLMVVKITVDVPCNDSTIYLDGKIVYAREVGLLFKYLSVDRGQTHELLIAGRRRIIDAVGREDTLNVLMPCY